MIKNERQYRITAAEAERFENALTDRPANPPNGSNVHPRLWEAEAEAMRLQLAELQKELRAYESLRAGQSRTFAVRDLAELPRALIQARIASGLSHKELAERLRLPEQA